MREEQHHIRDLRFSQWIRKNCPSSTTGWTTTDVDFVLRNYKTKRLALVEVKCQRASMTYAQEQILKHLHNMIIVGKRIYPDWTYAGLWLIQFENETPNDGRIWIDGIEVNEQQLAYYMGEIVHPRDGVAPMKNEWPMPNHPSVTSAHSADSKNQKG